MHGTRSKWRKKVNNNNISGSIYLKSREGSQVIVILSISRLYWIGHTKYGNWHSRKVRPTDMNTVAIPPPINPSQVFLGLSLMRGVRPMKNPNMYAMQSLITTIRIGMMNQINPETIMYLNSFSRSKTGYQATLLVRLLDYSCSSLTKKNDF